VGIIAKVAVDGRKHTKILVKKLKIVLTSVFGISEQKERKVRCLVAEIVFTTYTLLNS
jgi:hypothetical protein